jgi:hypothetical protein
LIKVTFVPPHTCRQNERTQPRHDTTLQAVLRRDGASVVRPQLEKHFPWAA